MPKKKTTKKSRVTIENEGNSIEQVFDYAKFKTMFEKWKEDCGKSGEDLHTKSTTTLFTSVSNHGQSGSHRPQSKDKSTLGAGEIVQKLDKLIPPLFNIDQGRTSTNHNKYIGKTLATAIKKTKYGKKIKNNHEKSLPMKRMLSSKDVANMVSFLVHQNSKNITGQDIFIDGGEHLI